MTGLKTRAARSPAALAQKLFKLERCGRYDDALNEVADIWPDPAEQPDLADLPASDAAEIRLRLGAVIGFHGEVAQNRDLQDVSLDLLSRARRDFEDSGSIEKAAECDNYLALGYWRKGATEEADVLVGEALAARMPESSPIRLYSWIIRCLIRMPKRSDAGNLAQLESIEQDVWKFGDDCLKGDYFNHRGIACDNLNRPEEALKNFELARHFHRRSRHRNYLGTIENNLAWFFKKHADFGRAHQAADNSVKLFRSAKDKTREGFALDTKATIFLTEGKHAEALNCVEKALAILSRSGNAEYRAATQLTKSTILLEMGNFQDAVLALLDAVDLAQKDISETAARRLIDDFEKAYTAVLTRDNSIHHVQTSDKLNLLLPEAIAHFADYRGMRVTNDHLAAFGLERGSLAIVACCEVVRGDLAVVSSLDSDEVFSGVFDQFAGIISLEDPGGGEPRLFDETQVRILGTIVGRGDESVPGSDRIPVRPLTV